MTEFGLLEGEGCSQRGNSMSKFLEWGKNSAVEGNRTRYCKGKYVTAVEGVSGVTENMD